MQAVILCGGKGTRIQHIAGGMPKVLLPVGGKPLLVRQIELLHKAGIRDIILCIGHLGSKIRESCGDGSLFGVRIRYAEETNPLGTGGALLHAAHLINEDFVVLYGDLYMDMDMEKFLEFHKREKAAVSMVLHLTDHPWDSDLVEIDSQNRVVRMHGKLGKLEAYPTALSKTSVYACEQRILELLPPGKSDLDKDILPLLISRGKKVCGYVTKEFVKDAGTPERYADVADHAGAMQRGTAKQVICAAFLDRDGVINEEVDLLHRKSQLKLLKNAGKAISLLNKHKIKVIIITNQPVVARNLCTEEELNDIHNHLRNLLQKEGAKIDGIYYCPHHPDKGYREENPLYKKKCDCRKPSTGMVEKAINDFSLLPEECVFIGDSTVDIETGRRAGIWTMLVRTGHAGKDGKFAAKADWEAADLLEAAQMVLSINEGKL